VKAKNPVQNISISFKNKQTILFYLPFSSGPAIQGQSKNYSSVPFIITDLAVGEAPLTNHKNKERLTG
jgi:hypothetical protein